MRVLSNWANLEAATCCFGTELVLSFSFLLLHADNFMNESWISTLHSLSSRKYRQISVADSLFFFFEHVNPIRHGEKMAVKGFLMFCFYFFFSSVQRVCVLVDGDRRDGEPGGRRSPGPGSAWERHHPPRWVFHPTLSPHTAYKHGWDTAPCGQLTSCLSRVSKLVPAA